VNTKSIRFRLIAGYTILITAVVMGFGTYTYMKANSYLRLVLEQSLLRRAEAIAASLKTDVDRIDGTELAKEVRDRYTPEQNDRFIRMSEGKQGVFYVSGQPIDRSFDASKVPLTKEWPAKPATLEMDAGGESKLLLVVVKVAVPEHQYLVEVGFSEEGNDRVLRGLLVTLLIGLPVVVIVAAGGGSVLLQSALRPVRDMIDKANEISHHELNARLPVHYTGDDLEQLSITLNQMITRLQESLLNSRRFTTDASHELRTPLTIIRGELEQLLTRKDIPDSIGERVASLMEETDRLIGIAEGLLTLSRLDAGEALRENVRADLGEMAAATAEQMSLLAEEKEIELICVRHTPAEVKGDRSGLKRIIVNLLDNAIKYTPAHGKVRIDVRAEKRHAYLQVSDNGIGVRKEDLIRVFDRFYRAESVRSTATGGTGLGLSIVHSICAAHGGTVYAENLTGGGSRFVVTLPLAD
jgi:heavy metal sensor kinase